MENHCGMDPGKRLSFKIAIISFTIIVLSVWEAARDWVFGISVWWFVIIFIVSLLNSGGCGGKKNVPSSGTLTVKKRKQRKKKKK